MKTTIETPIAGSRGGAGRFFSERPSEGLPGPGACTLSGGASSSPKGGTALFARLQERARAADLPGPAYSLRRAGKPAANSSCVGVFVVLLALFSGSDAIELCSYTTSGCTGTESCTELFRDTCAERVGSPPYVKITGTSSAPIVTSYSDTYCTASQDIGISNCGNCLSGINAKVTCGTAAAGGTHLYCRNCGSARLCGNPDNDVRCAPVVADQCANFYDPCTKSTTTDKYQMTVATNGNYFMARYGNGAATCEPVTFSGSQKTACGGCFAVFGVAGFMGHFPCTQPPSFAPSGYAELIVALNTTNDGPFPGPRQLSNIATITACASACDGFNGCSAFAFNENLQRCTIKVDGEYTIGGTPMSGWRYVVRDSPATGTTGASAPPPPPATTGRSAAGLLKPFVIVILFCVLLFL